MSCGVGLLGAGVGIREAFVVICCRDIVPWIIAKLILHFGLNFQESDGSENL